MPNSNNGHYLTVMVLAFYPLTSLILCGLIFINLPTRKSKRDEHDYEKLHFLRALMWQIKIVNGNIEAPLQFSLNVSTNKQVGCRAFTDGTFFFSKFPGLPALHQQVVLEMDLVLEENRFILQ